jgi:outer membrane protein OmpA-like peptidoglycan-associated protein
MQKSFAILICLLCAIMLSISSSFAQDEDATEKKDEDQMFKKIVIINLGPNVNFDGLDYAPTISADGRTLFYVSDRFGSKLYESGEYSHDFWAVKKEERLDTIFFPPYNIDTTTSLGDLGVNTSLNEGASSIAADRQSLYFTGCDRSDGLGSCDIYKTSIEGDKWGRPINLGRNVNSEYWDSQPSIAPDQSRIYFVSERPGPNSDGEVSRKNHDIWYSDWDYDMEEWLPAKNLEQINTPDQEGSPFIAADNSTLFFASMGHEPNFGGLDFYVTRYDAGSKTWSKPENLGEPINTEGNEQFISLPASGDIIYFASTREDLPNFQGSFDIFMAFVPVFFKAVNVVGTVVDECSRENIPAFITIKNPITGREKTDSLSDIKTKFEYIVTNNDYGDPKDSNVFVDLEITAVNPTYGSSSIVQRVNKPDITQNKEEAGAIEDEINVVITLGQTPVLDADIDEAAHVTKYKDSQPELKDFWGLVMKKTVNWELYPLLNYIFFDQGKSDLRERYITFDSMDDIKEFEFSDNRIPGGTLDKYYHVLNIYGYRMTNNPESKITLYGTVDAKEPDEKSKELALARAQTIYDYFKNVWQIDESRMTIKTYPKLRPQHQSNPRDSLGIQENRRVEIVCPDWEIMKPIFDKDPKLAPEPKEMTFIMENGIQQDLIKARRIEVTQNDNEWITLDEVGLADDQFVWDWKSKTGQYPTTDEPFVAKMVITTNTGAECESEPFEIDVMFAVDSTRRIESGEEMTDEIYNLILFPFDKATMGKFNERIMKDYVYSRVFGSSKVHVEGHTDVVGLYEHNKRLSIRRAKSVFTDLKQTTKGKYGELTTEGVGEDEPLYTNDTPEGRFYNRTVQVRIQTPKSEFNEEPVEETEGGTE